MREFLYLLATDKKNGFIAGILKFFLLMLSFIYAAVIRILKFFYFLKPRRLGCKVISIGNITLGGTGKTPLVQMLATELKQKGHKVAILSRGYKRKNKRYTCLTDKQALYVKPASPPACRQGRAGGRYEDMGDEPYMLSRRLIGIPVVVNKDRLKAAKTAISDFGADTLILDDGFQQWRIKKDLEIVAVDAVCPFGNSRMLPRGILREPLSCLRRADILVITKINLASNTQDTKDTLARLNPRALVVQAGHKPLGFYKLGDLSGNMFLPDEFSKKQVSLVCGIADPASFEKLISQMGIEVGLTFRFTDHHNYTQNDINKIVNLCKQKGINNIITTEKDSVRLSAISYQLSAISYFVLRIESQILEYETFFNRVHSLL